MDEVATAFVTIGVLLLLGLLADAAGRRAHVPRVTMLLILGFLVGPGGIDALPDQTEQWFPIVTQLAVVMVGFVIGAEFTIGRLREHGGAMVTIGLVQACVTVAVVAVALLAVGAETELALPLGAVAVRMLPAATVAVIHDLEARGPLTRTVLAVVAIDDVAALALFALSVAAAASITGVDGAWGLVGDAGWEVVGGVALGCALGAPAAALTGRLQPGEPTREEAYGIVLLCAGLAIWFDVSFILAAVVMGAIVANLARHHDYPFQEIESIEWPFLTLFFFLAGARLELGQLSAVGVLGATYVGARIVGKVLGASAGGRIARQSPSTSRRLGVALLPQAGIALGLSLEAAERFPSVADDIIAVVVAATVFFELIGPLLTRWALAGAGETG